MNSNISERAMLVSLSIAQFSIERQDKKVAKEISDKYNSKSDRGKYSKSIIDPAAIETIKQIAGEARTMLYVRSLPWDDNGFRIMASAGYFDLAAAQKEIEARFWAAVDVFCAKYPDLVESAKADLNGLWKASDYPPVGRVREKFDFRWSVRPVPTGNDFRVDLGDAEVDRIRKDIETASRNSVEAAMQDAWGRMADVVRKMAEKLKAYKITKDGVENPFRDTLVSNIEDLLNVLPALNVTGDRKLEEFAKTIRKELCQHDADELRRNHFTRQDVAKRADEILNKMEGFLA